MGGWTTELALGATLCWLGSIGAVTAASVIRRTRLLTSAPRPPTGLRVLLVRPCAGLEPHLLRTVSSVVSARHSFQLRVVLSVGNEADPALPVLHEAAASLRARGLDARACIATPHGPNHKVGQLATVVAEHGEDADVVVVVDSDVDLDDVDLDMLVSPLAENVDLGATWIPVVERDEAPTWGDRASAAVLGGSLHAFPLLGALDPEGLVGKVFAVRARALGQVGGFESLCDYLGEDMELARRLRDAGWHTTMLGTLGRSRAEGRSLSTILDRYTRWLLVIRAQRPALLASYPLLLAFTPVLVVTGLVLAMVLPSAGAGIVLAGISLRVAIASMAARVAQRRRSAGGRLLDVVLADFVLTVAFVRALMSRQVRWRGRSLRLDQHGRLCFTQPGANPSCEAVQHLL